MEDKRILPETVILIDTPYLDFIINDVKGNFERILSRKLPDLDLVSFLVYLSMDAGAQSDKGGAEVVFVSDDENFVLSSCSPKDLRSQLDGLACMTEIGEMSFTVARTEGLTTLKDLYKDTILHINKLKGIKRIALVTDDADFDMIRNEIAESKSDNVDIIDFRMDRKTFDDTLGTELLIYPMLRAFGVRSEELS